MITLMWCVGAIIYSFHEYDPPLLYDLHSDSGELYALDSSSTKYADVVMEIQFMHCITQPLMISGVSCISLV